MIHGMIQSDDALRLVLQAEDGVGLRRKTLCI